jgi:ribosomal protein S18 acetylase RimI-like enzyme
MSVAIRPAAEDDLAGLAGLDFTYPRDRILVLKRSGRAPEHTFTFRWSTRGTGSALYNEYTTQTLHQALSRADLFLVAEIDGELAGLLMVLVPTWTDAAEVTDLALHLPLRRRGGGRALLDSATAWARGRGLRALWVEPRTDNADAIQFYASLGFRVSGFNDRLYSDRDHEDGRVTFYMYRNLI